MGFLKDHFDPIASMASSVLSSMLNNRAQRNQQQREMDFALQSYGRQRTDVLADRAHEEQYNSPIQQQARLRAAGMNPIDYMSDPVSTSTGDSGQINQPTHADVGFADLGSLMMQNAQLKQQKMMNESQKQVNTALADMYKSEAEKNRNDIGNDNTRLGMEKDKLDAYLREVDSNINAQDIDNQMKKQLYQHNRVMYGYEETIARVDSELKVETKNLVKSKLVKDVQLTGAQIDNLQQTYRLRGPDEAIAECLKLVYGANHPQVVSMLTDQFNGDTSAASAYACEMALKEQITDTKDESKKFAGTLWEFFTGMKIAGAEKSAESSLRGAVGAAVKVIGG